MTPSVAAIPSGPSASVDPPIVGKQLSPSNGATTASRDMPNVPLIDLYSGSQASMAITDAALREQIIDGLRGKETFVIPGHVDSPDDRRFAFRRTLPTTILYSEQGLLLYDKLVEAPEYYLWNAEIDILTRHASEMIRRAFGASSASDAKNGKSDQHGSHDDSNDGDDNEREQQQRRRKDDYPPPQQNSTNANVKEKWGDNRVGLHNGGVNAEEGLDGDRAIGAASLIELGAGSLRKTVNLIRALKEVSNEKQDENDVTPCNVQYYALDLDKAELIRTLKELHTQEARDLDAKQWQILNGAVGINGMWATYDQGLEFIGQGGLSKTKAGDGKRCFLWLGSSIGNFDRRGAAEFLERATAQSLRPGDTMLISIDRRNTPDDIAKAYNDGAGLTRDFIMQGIAHADKILGGGVLDPGHFEYFDRYNADEGRHESYYRVIKDLTIQVPGDGSKDDAGPIEIEAGELIHVESSYKYNEREALDIFDYAGLRVVNRWTDKDERYDIWLVERPTFHFCSTRLMTGSRKDIGQGLSPAQANGIRGSWEYDSDAGAGSNSIKEPFVHATWGLPSLKDWDEMWRAWDTVTLTMIPPSMLHEKPIDLRHICLFYIGHIPAFLDIMIARTLHLPHTNKHYSNIFERGIDPHMDDETKCNPHSEVPKKQEDWPNLSELLTYRKQVQERVTTLYEDLFNGVRKLDRRTARLFWLTLEHQALHLETLLYMLIQSPKTLPPNGFLAPDWALLRRTWDEEDVRQGGERAREQLYNFKADTVTIGHDDDDALDYDFLAPRPTRDVYDLNVQLGHPTFGWDNENPTREAKTGAFSITASPINNEQYWAFLQAENSKDYPSSWLVDDDQVPLVRTFYGPVDLKTVARLWPCQASGDQLERYAKWKGGRLPTQAELRRFLDANSGPNVTDRPGTNIGFRNWHPVPAQLPRPDHDGTPLAGHNGGVWEWTSSVLEEYPGYKQSVLYPGYSSDFFDGKHNIILGGSYVTTPSIAGRRTAVNWYQKPYPYVFAGARVVYDAQTRTRARTMSPKVTPVMRTG